MIIKPILAGKTRGEKKITLERSQMLFYYLLGHAETGNFRDEDTVYERRELLRKAIALIIRSKEEATGTTHHYLMKEADNLVEMKCPLPEASKVLRRLEEEAEVNDNPYWIVHPKTGTFLNRLVRENKIKRVLEVGTSVGYSGIWIAEALSHTGGKLYTVESNKGRFEMAAKNFKAAGLADYIKQIEGHAPDVEIPDIFDLLFLDATKREHLAYLTTFLFHMKKGGIIVADNAKTHERELAKYKEYIFNSPQLKSELKHIGTGIYVSTIV